jgi:transketolase
MDAMKQLATSGIKARVVSMACTEVFDRQPLEWREGVLPSWCRKRVAIEAGVSDFWRKYVGLDGAVIGMDTFGASAPAEVLFPYFGFTDGHVVEAVKALG